MATVLPFRRLRFDLSRIGGDPGDAIAFDPGEPRRGAQEPPSFHVERLADPSAGAALAREWIGKGALVLDDEPGFQVYEQSFTATVSGVDARFRRRVLLAALPAERDREPKEGVWFRPRRCIHDDDGLRVRTLLADAATARPPWFVHLDKSSVEHRLHAVADPGWIAAIQEAFLPVRIVPLGGSEAGPFRLAALASLEDPGLVTLPVHRLVPAWPGLDAWTVAGILREEGFEVEDYPWTGPDGAAALLAALAPERHAFGILFRGSDTLQVAHLPREPRRGILDATLLAERIEAPLRRAARIPGSASPIVDLRDGHRLPEALHDEPGLLLALLQHPASPREVWEASLRDGVPPPARCAQLFPPVASGVAGLWTDDG